MLIEKKARKPVFAVIKQDKGKIIKMDAEEHIEIVVSRKQPCLMPPADQFNTGYLKPKKHDPL